MIIKNYSIYNNKQLNNTKIAVFSDIHFGNKIEYKKLNKIKQDLIKQQPKYICVPGDLIISTNILEKEKTKENIIDFFKSISNIAPIFLILGNHDITKIINQKQQEDKNSFWYNEFKKLKKYNIHLLNNEIYEDKNIRFIGYTLPYSYYNNNESIDILIKNFKQNINNIDDKKYNILLCHSPIKILEKEALENIPTLKNIDLVLTGHMHNGMVPKILDKIFPKNRGIIAPNKTLFPKNARGIKEITLNDKKITLLISGGITKIQETNSKILKICSKFYSPQIEYIEIKEKV